jgi:hypothetical protein
VNIQYVDVLNLGLSRWGKGDRKEIDFLSIYNYTYSFPPLAVEKGRKKTGNIGKGNCCRYLTSTYAYAYALCILPSHIILPTYSNLGEGGEAFYERHGGIPTIYTAHI